MNINLIVSASTNWTIGKNNTLPWKLRSDLKRFKDLTTGNVIVMGRKTFESLPKGALPDRTNVVMTLNEEFAAPGTIPAAGIMSVFKVADEHDKSGEIFIIGGSSIYELFLPLADKVYLTRVHAEIAGDTSFPNIDEMPRWEPTLTEEIFPADEKNEYPYSYQIYKRKDIE